MAGTSSESIVWELGNAPKQSITEVLQNPRGGPSLELPELSAFDLSAAAAFASPSPATQLPTPLNINHFEPYLRRYAPLHASFASEKRRLEDATTKHLASKEDDSDTALHDIPSVYFESSFSVSRNHELAELQSPHTSISASPATSLQPSDVQRLRETLAAYRTALEKAMRTRLMRQSSEISSSLTAARSLRTELATAATKLRTARLTAAQLIPAVANGLSATRAVSAVQTNVRALRTALSTVQQIQRAPNDVTLLLQSGEYSAAIAVVAKAKAALANRDLSPVLSLAPARARLAQAAESIDGALREEVRAALQAPSGEEQRQALNDVMELVASMGRLPLLRGFFLKEIRIALEHAIKSVNSLPIAAKLVKESASQALMLVTIIHSAEEGETEQGVPPAKQLKDVHDSMEEMLTSATDRFLNTGGGPRNGGNGGNTFVVITDLQLLTEETCFDEFKAALQFGEEVRTLEQVATDLENMFACEKKSSPLRAKISERQISFIGAFHRTHVEALTEAVRADTWQELRVPQGVLKLLAATISEEGGEAQSTNTDLKALNGNGVHKDAQDTTSPEKQEIVEGAVVIGSGVFKTVASGVRYLRSMCAYTLLAEKSPNLASEIARRASELSRLFNSLVAKAILGAAALQWSGLRSITARHLSLASRTVAMAAALADHINRPLEKALSGSQIGVILPLIQKSEKDLRDHHGQLLAKILAIMMDRLEAHESVLKALPWEKEQEMSRFDVPSAYLTTLVKESTVLHRILWSILPKTEVCDIFQRVCAAYGTHLTEAYGSLDGGKKWVLSRVAEDVTCLHERLALLEVFKSNPAALKPITRLYNRFAREYKDANKAVEAENSNSVSTSRTIIHSPAVGEQ